MSAKPIYLGALCLLGLGVAPMAQEHPHPAGEKLGTVHFQTSCNRVAQGEFDRAMALLHSFEFGPAIAGFTAAAKADAGCEIGRAHV